MHPDTLSMATTKHMRCNTKTDALFFSSTQWGRQNIFFAEHGAVLSPMDRFVRATGRHATVPTKRAHDELCNARAILGMRGSNHLTTSRNPRLTHVSRALSHHTLKDARFHVCALCEHGAYQTTPVGLGAAASDMTCAPRYTKQSMNGAHAA